MWTGTRSTWVACVTSLTLLCLSTPGACQSVDLTPAYGPAVDGRAYIFEFLDATGEPTGVKEQMRIKYYGPATFTIERVYAQGDLFCETCPRVEDRYEWRATGLYYVETVNYYDQSAVTYHAPGHLWLTTEETLAFARHQPAVGTSWTLEVKWCQELSRQPRTMRQSDFWRAVYAERTESPFTGPVEGYRLDEVTVEGQWDSYWKESWYFTDHPDHGLIPVRTRGWRQLPGRPLVELWHARLVGIR